MSDPNVRRVFLILSGAGIGPLSFVAPPEFTDGYANELTANAPEHRTHPGQHLWKKGAVEDMNITLHLVAGISPEIETAERLKQVVEDIWSMSLPASGENYVPVITMSLVGTGHLWFQRKVFMSKVSTKWKEPFHLSTGIYMAADVSMSLKPTYVEGTSFDAAVDDKLPKRPYSFTRG